MLALVLVVGVVVLGFVGFDCVFYVVAVMTGCGCGCGCFFFRWWWLAVGCEFLFDIFLIAGYGWWQWVGGREEI